MDKFKTIAVGGLGLILDDFRWFFGRLTNPNDGMYEAFNNLLRGYGDNFIVQGVVASGTTPNVAITEGWVILDGELIKVDAQTGIDTASDNKFVKVTTFDPRGTKTFLNGSINETYEKNRAVVQGTSGNLDFDANNFSDLRSTTTQRIVAVETEQIFKTKVIEIGDWDMVATGSVNASHGIASGVSKIRQVTALILTDNGFSSRVLSQTVSGGVAVQGIIVDDVNVTLTRESGGDFDSTAFDSVSFNRGWITIHYIP